MRNVGNPGGPLPAYMEGPNEAQWNRAWDAVVKNAGSLTVDVNHIETGEFVSAIPATLKAEANGKEEGATKSSNPKDAIGSRKAPLHLVPETVNVYASQAFLEGALKYGKYNWRAAGVRVSVYLDAMKRHLAKYENGQDVDPTTLVHHLGNIIACAGIILDAQHSGKLTDDRPPASPGLVDLIDQQEALVAHLKDVFKDHKPHQWTIQDDV